jgi:nucleotide-binding universal stress UspA family protein
MSTVLLAVDETSESEHAARIARELFGPSANYLALSVTDRVIPWYPLPMAWGGVYPYAVAYPPVGEVVGDSVRAEEREAHDIAAAAAANADVDAEAVGVAGDPVDAILQAAEEHDVDVIVVGASERSWWQRLFEGSVSNDVTRLSHRPVLLVRRG